VIALGAWTDIAQAQWVLLARRAIGRVEQMSQTSQDGKTTYDTATVMVEVPVDRVYDTVQRSVRAAQGISITNEDPAARRIQFTNGAQIAGIQAVSFGDSLTQLMVSSAHGNAPKPPTSIIVERIIAVCKDMNVECSRSP
jgi:hypothetical protein